MLPIQIETVEQFPIGGSEVIPEGERSRVERDNGAGVGALGGIEFTVAGCRKNRSGGRGDSSAAPDARPRGRRFKEVHGMMGIVEVERVDARLRARAALPS